ncbi:MAG: NADH-quinone oxidoreductase subunit I, partial [candidate division Zixibacteria bacterium]|nr:NADH-quinone oxidoreductase subunit I [candidate division Zixibacteria bacterium]NIR63684.1 NADH-quinone oxidoreductase subunit I [candidate division Zixibacteria bacterium]NIS18335.1 NADH-quinone oxidoreductase subunit I [candidate division Zixibacteria bacterium]NIS45637.1 NADH-quinone oxidoreductase subunit I [candidate division Zixibacteria bacterium]NIT54662.1 NADH-quinone oxidoreductase subunit I [candidate division Zixibacteria bacterium]
MGLVKDFFSGIYNLVVGLFVTGKHLGRHAITLQYPKERWEMPERSRGVVVLLSNPETGEL